LGRRHARLPSFWVTTVVGAVAVPGVLFALSLPFGEERSARRRPLPGAVGLLTGLIRIVLAVFAAALVGGVVIVGLLVARRVTLRSFIPFGPFLIVGAVWAVLIPASS